MSTCLTRSSLLPSVRTTASTFASYRVDQIRHRYCTDSQEDLRRQRKNEWKRRQGGQTFLDNLIINVRGGKGGDGCVAFHREKFKPFGPPSGGNGGRGGDVYILPTPHLTNLSSVPKRIRGEAGASGQGAWRNGRHGSPLVIKVPLGTVVRELKQDDPQRAKDEWEAEDESLEGLSLAEKRSKMRENRWVHYPRYGEDNIQRDAFKEFEGSLYKQERERRFLRKKRASHQPIHLDLNKEESVKLDADAPLGIRQSEPLGHLIASGGLGGLGNPHFLSPNHRSPKFASRGCAGERITLSLELKLLADIGLVGMPNAGKSTLLRALTGGRAKSQVASYIFTTLNPVVGVVRVAQDGTFEGSVSGIRVHDETWVEEQQEREKMERGEYADTPTRNETRSSSITEASTSELRDNDVSEPDTRYRGGHQFDIAETFRFTIADNPGLISGASENAGLGHAFLRSLERSLALVYVLDLSEPAPWDQLGVLRDELEKYQPGMSSKARLIIANKADLLGGINDAAAVEEAKEKLRRLEEFVGKEMGLHDKMLDVVPTSAKFSQNMARVVTLMQKYVEQARRQTTEDL